MMTYQVPTEFTNNSSHRNAPNPLKQYPHYLTNVKSAQYCLPPQQKASSQVNYEELHLCRVMCSWVGEQAEPLIVATAQHYLRLIRDIMVLINPNALKDNLLISTVFYADTFVKKRGVKLEESRKAFLVLLISALVTIKMWEDFEVKTETLEIFTGISRKQIAVLERQFLGVLEYSLVYTNDDILSWQIETCFPQPPSA